MRFRRVNVNRLPRVMVKCLALDDVDRGILMGDLRLAAGEPSAGAWGDAVREVEVEDDPSLAVVFAAILDLPKDARAEFAERFDRLLDAQGDLFGTEGQCDPRGDRRG